MKIKNLEDARKIITLLKQGTFEKEEVGDYPDTVIRYYVTFPFKNFPYQGTTKIIYCPKSDTFFVYSYGSNWCDQGITYMDEDKVTKFAWKNRRWLNKALK